MGIQLIKNALEYAMIDGCIKHKLVQEYVGLFAPDRRYKLVFLASDCYKEGCGSGIVKYRGREYYFCIVNDCLLVQYN